MKHCFARLILSIPLIFFSQCKSGILPTEVPKTEKTIESEPGEPSETYILVDTEKEILSIRQNGSNVAEFHNIAFGSSGVGIKQKKGDNITPLGKFSIGWITEQSHFKLFIGLNYPTLDYAERGLSQKIIKKKDFDHIRLALEQGKIPPQNTALGGLIGIHGLGKASLKIHKLANWTSGCIALDNKQIENLRRLVHPKMTVIIR